VRGRARREVGVKKRKSFGDSPHTWPVWVHPTDTMPGIDHFKTDAVADEEFQRMESELRENEDELNACTRLFFDISWYRYNETVPNGVGLMNPPPLPTGVVDVAEFSSVVAAMEHEIAMSLRQAALIREEMQLIEDMESGGALGVTARQFRRAEGKMAGLRRDLALSEEKENKTRDSLWRYLNAVKMVDGNGFQESMSGLLHKRMELMLAQRKSVAERMMMLRGDPMGGMDSE